MTWTTLVKRSFRFIKGQQKLQRAQECNSLTQSCCTQIQEKIIPYQIIPYLCHLWYYLGGSFFYTKLIATFQVKNKIKNSSLDNSHGSFLVIWANPFMQQILKYLSKRKLFLKSVRKIQKRRFWAHRFAVPPRTIEHKQ